VFSCTPLLNGRLYPSPGTPDVYILDFVNSQQDSQGTRVHNTGLKVFNRGPLGRVGRRAVSRLGSTDFFMFNCSQVIEITDGEHQRLKVFTFSYLDSPIAFPVFIN
jgi:hypothetical protein